VLTFLLLFQFCGDAALSSLLPGNADYFFSFHSRKPSILLPFSGVWVGSVSDFFWSSYRVGRPLSTFPIDGWRITLTIRRGVFE